MSADRREFLQASGAGLAGAVMAASLAETARAAANDRPRVAVIGTGGMGGNHVQTLARNNGVELAYLCDVDENRLAANVKTVKELSGKEPKPVRDMREIFADRSIDAVWIATPDHWHAPAAILAADAKKHVYVEKPCSHNLREGRLLIEAAERNKVVVQVGTQTRSSAHAIKAIDRLRSGVIGEILVAKAWNSQLRREIGKTQPSEPPKTLDFDLWLGPAPTVPYRSNMLPGIWRWWHAFGCGDIGNDGVHDIDIARWGLGVSTHPTRIAALGGKSFFDDDQQWPDTQTVVFEYAGAAGGRPKQLIFEQRIWSPYVQESHENGNAFYGTEGFMIFGKRGRYEIYGKRNKLIEQSDGAGPDLPAHHADFLDRAKNGGTARAAIADAHYSTSLCHLANVSTRVGRLLNFDPTAERFQGDDEATALLRRAYRESHWAVPKGV